VYITPPSKSKVETVVYGFEHLGSWIVYGRQFYDQTLSDLCVQIVPSFFRIFSETPTAAPLIRFYAPHHNTTHTALQGVQSAFNNQHSTFTVEVAVHYFITNSSATSTPQ
jgi:hypothetical protein